MSTLLRLLACVLLPATVSAQTLAWDQPIAGERADRYELSLDGGTTWTVNLGLPPHTVGATALTYATPLPSVPAGSVLAVRGCNTGGCSTRSNTVTIGNVEPPPPPPPCSGIADLPTVFVTRWEHTTGAPGSRFRLNFQLGGSQPIVEVQARIAGQTRATITGTDLRDTGGIWLTTPPAGSYPTSIWVKAANGCTREAAALVNLVVK